jgi:hypothetical protein
MGLFDTLRCEHPLPDGSTERDFQTKSLGCTLETFILTPAGRLLRADGADSGFHGLMRFYTRDSAGSWLEYEAKFTDGALQHLVQSAWSDVSMYVLRNPAAGGLRLWRDRCSAWWTPRAWRGSGRPTSWPSSPSSKRAPSRCRYGEPWSA